MLETLKKVKLSVAKRDLVPLQRCFHFYEGRVQGNNGAVCLDAPLDFFGMDEITIDSEKLYRAARLCKGDFNYSFTNSRKMIISKKGFRAVIPYHEKGVFDLTTRDAGPTITSTNMLEILRRLRPFISEDASRPWSRSILFRKGFAYATNNITIARLPAPLVHDINVPVHAVDILLELGMEPLTIAATETSIVFVFGNDMWLRSQLVAGEWPDVDSLIVESVTQDLGEYFAEVVENLTHFCDDPKYPMITLGEFGISTTEGLSEATMDLGDFPHSIFRAEPLLLVARNAYAIAFSSYPKACYFEGEDGLEGMILGIITR